MNETEILQGLDRIQTSLSDNVKVGKSVAQDASSIRTLWGRWQTQFRIALGLFVIVSGIVIFALLRIATIALDAQSASEDSRTAAKAATSAAQDNQKALDSLEKQLTITQETLEILKSYQPGGTNYEASQAQSRTLIQELINNQNNQAEAIKQEIRQLK